MQHFCLHEAAFIVRSNKQDRKEFEIRYNEYNPSFFYSSLDNRFHWWLSTTICPGVLVS